MPNTVVDFWRMVWTETTQYDCDKMGHPAKSTAMPFFIPPARSFFPRTGKQFTVRRILCPFTLRNFFAYVMYVEVKLHA